MPLVGEQVWVSPAKVRHQPLAVCKGREPILCTLPDRHRYLCLSEVEAPRLDEG